MVCLLWFVGGNNDINVFDRNPLVANFLKGDGQDMSFEVNGHRYPHYYMLADGSIPKWIIFVQTVHFKKLTWADVKHPLTNY